MSEDKQIYEMAKNVCHLDRTCDECMTSFECKAMMYAKRFYNAGFRKASEVAREIFGMLREDLRGFVDGDYLERLLAIYEKKYTEGGK